MIAKFEKRIVWDKIHATVFSYKHLHNLPHWHVEHELLYVRFGTVEVMVNNNFFTLTAGMCAFIKGEEVHYIKAGADSVVDVIKIDSVYVKHIAEQKNLISPVLVHDYCMKQSISELMEEIKEQKEYSNIIVDSIIIKLIARIFRNETTVKSEGHCIKINQKYKALLEWIANRYADITFEDAAKYMNLSKPYFSKYFHRITGMTFTQYLNMLKVSAAVEEIAKGSMNLTEIAIACGFGTIRNFNRVFKALTGYSPKQLPDSYVFIYNFKRSSAYGFDPTLHCTEILDTL